MLKRLLPLDPMLLVLTSVSAASHIAMADKALETSLYMIPEPLTTFYNWSGLSTEPKLHMLSYSLVIHKNRIDLEYMAETKVGKERVGFPICPQKLTTQY